MTGPERGLMAGRRWATDWQARADAAGAELGQVAARARRPDHSAVNVLAAVWACPEVDGFDYETWLGLDAVECL